MVPRYKDPGGQLKFGCRSTSYTGVYRCKRNTVRWRTQFSYGGKVLNVGSYNTEAEAAQAWNAAAIHFRGRATLLNAVQPQLPEDGGVAVATSLPQPPWGSQLLNSMPGEGEEEGKEGEEERQEREEDAEAAAAGAASAAQQQQQQQQQPAAGVDG
ncbi:hypothetical protein OEZ86_011218 [Tetradesmus obliquus]|nr:hypothetical protein OEZ86_011218 [Tetradesmus obliquus]